MTTLYPTIVYYRSVIAKHGNFKVVLTIAELYVIVPYYILVDAGVANVNCIIPI